MDKKILFFDTETTGNEEKDRLIQVAYKMGEKFGNELFKPEIPISYESMAVHHITTKMVADKPEFKYSKMFDELHKMAHDPNIVFVAHNAPFDLAMFKKEGLIPENYICTLKVARKLDTEEKISSYRLQYLRYFLDIEIEATAHDAFGDVLVLEKLFDRLFAKIQKEENLSWNETIEKMIEITRNPLLMKRINFGKYKGQTVEEIAQKDPGYLKWLLDEKLKAPTGEEDWIYTLEYYLKK